MPIGVAQQSDSSSDFRKGFESVGFVPPEADNEAIRVLISEQASGSVGRDVAFGACEVLERLM
jgi:hypothetical protein